MPKQIPVIEDPTARFAVLPVPRRQEGEIHRRVGWSTGTNFGSSSRFATTEAASQDRGSTIKNARRTPSLLMIDPARLDRAGSPIPSYAGSRRHSYTPPLSQRSPSLANVSFR
jgi:hypothetical protein